MIVFFFFHIQHPISLQVLQEPPPKYIQNLLILPFKPPLDLSNLYLLPLSFNIFSLIFFILAFALLLSLFSQSSQGGTCYDQDRSYQYLDQNFLKVSHFLRIKTNFFPSAFQGSVGFGTEIIYATFLFFLNTAIMPLARGMCTSVFFCLRVSCPMFTQGTSHPSALA